MTAITADAPPLTPTLRQRLRRGRGWIVTAAIVTATIVVAVFLGGQATAQAVPLDPGSASPTGAKAVLTVLRQYGVTVRTASDLAAAEASARRVASGSLTVAVYDPDRYVSARRLAAADRLDGRIVLIAPASGMAAALRTAGREVDVVASAKPFENGHILEDGNAGEAIRLLGARSTLIWYTPSPADAATAAPATLAELTPPWVTPAIVLGFLVALAAGVWRGRRLGPLVEEDLPVVVRASEALEGRARLYQRSDARLHALDALRIGAIGRLSGLLGLGPRGDVDAVISAAAARTGTAPAEVRAVLLDAEPNGDAALMDLARRAAGLEASVRDTISSTADARPEGRR